LIAALHSTTTIPFCLTIGASEAFPYHQHSASLLKNYTATKYLIVAVRRLLVLVRRNFTKTRRETKA